MHLRIMFGILFLIIIKPTLLAYEYSIENYLELSRQLVNLEFRFKDYFIRFG